MPILGLFRTTEPFPLKGLDSFPPRSVKLAFKTNIPLSLKVFPNKGSATIPLAGKEGFGASFCPKDMI